MGNHTPKFRFQARIDPVKHGVNLDKASFTGTETDLDFVNKIIHAFTLDCKTRTEYQKRFSGK